MLKTSNLLKFFLVLNPLLIYSGEETKTPSEVQTKSEAPKTIAAEIVKKERIDFLNDKIILEEKLLRELKEEEKKTDLKDALINEKIKIKETDILNAKNELAELTLSKNNFFKNAKEKLSICKQKISNRTYLVVFGKTLGAVALVGGIGYGIKTYLEKRNTSAE
jgi:biopolymer transport protein ExbD